MSRGTYLQRIARRAIQDTPGLLRPRRVVRTLPAPPPDDEAASALMPAAVSARMPAADPVQPPISAPVAPSAPSGAPPAIASQPAAHALVAASAPLPVPDVAPPAVPRRDVPFAPRAVDETSTVDTIQRPSRMEPPAVARDRRTEPIVSAPGQARRPVPPTRKILVAPDPLEVALAAAVRWTSSDERPSPTAPIAPTRSEREHHAGEGTREVGPVAGRERETPPRERPARAKQAPRAEADAATPRGLLTLPSPGSAPHATPSPAADRFTGIHIGSLEVQILPPPALVTPPVQRRSLPLSVAPPAPLARGFTSAIGLRQS
jgi:hypothetical protein